MKNVDTADFTENEYPLLQNLNYPSLLRFPSFINNCLGFSLCQFYSNLSLDLNFSLKNNCPLILPVCCLWGSSSASNLYLFYQKTHIP